MDVPAHAVPHLARAGFVVRHRLEGDAGGGEPDFWEDQETVAKKWKAGSSRAGVEIHLVFGF